jgi:hypothetical protein
MTEIYTFPQQSSIPHPSSGHQINQINLALCTELGLDERVISLMKWVPYPSHARIPDNETRLVHEFEFLHNARALNYMDDEDMCLSRDPVNQFLDEERRLDYLHPHDVALTLGEYRLGMGTVLFWIRELVSLPHSMEQSSFTSIFFVKSFP